MNFFVGFVFLSRLLSQVRRLWSFMILSQPLCMMIVCMENSYNYTLQISIQHSGLKEGFQKG